MGKYTPPINSLKPFPKGQVNFQYVQETLTLIDSKLVPEEKVINLNMELGYKFNVKTNMNLIFGYHYRKSSENTRTDYFYFSFRTLLNNQYFDL